jgi:hypothetical protein
MPAAPVAKQELLQRLAAGHAARISVVTPNRRLAQATVIRFDNTARVIFRDKGYTKVEGTRLVFSKSENKTPYDLYTSKICKTADRNKLYYGSISDYYFCILQSFNIVGNIRQY